MAQKENPKIKEQIIKINNSRLKIISLVSLGFSVFVLFTDFIIHGVWQNKYMYLFKILDIIFTVISVSSVSFFWFYKIKNIALQKVGIILFPFLFIIWSAVITGIGFSTLGLSTLIVVVLLGAFFLYLNLTISIIYFVSSGFALMATLYFLGDFNENYLSLIFLFIPIIGISVLVSARNYKYKINDLFNQEKLAEMNKQLQYSNENLEKEVEKRTSEILIALNKAEESDRLKSAFLTNMSHEIRTPMNGILGFAELLKDPGLTGEQQKEYISIIEKGGERMLNLINNLIDISKVEAGLMEISISEANINEQINYIYTFFKPEVEQKGMHLFFKNTLPEEEAIIRTDREKIYAILTNLVKNAVKYNSKGTIEFGYCLKTNDEPVDLEFFVKDTGVGIARESQETIFKRFNKTTHDENYAIQGAGLGLSISKAYVEMLGGKIWVESQPGEGSTFYFTIPYIIGKKENLVENDVPIFEGYQIKDLKILIAEDDKPSEMLLKIIAKMFGKEIIVARTGMETIEVCRNHPDIDLILMDIQMAGIDGYEATRQIREFNKKVIIIAQTAYAIDGDREKAIEAGCDDYISKPINRTELKRMIEKHFL